MNLRFCTANVYVGNRGLAVGIVRLVLALRPWRPPHSLGLQECSVHWRQLRTLLLYRVEVRGRTPIEHSNPVLVRRGLKRVQRTHQFLGAKGYESDGRWGTHPPRTVTTAFYRTRPRRGRRSVSVAHVNTHFHWVAGLVHEWQNLSWDDLPRVAREYHEHVYRVYQHCDRLLDSYDQVVLTCDGNARPLGSADWEHAVYNVFGRDPHWHVERHGVDCVITSRRGVDDIDVRTVSRGVFGSDDHDALAVRLDRR